MHPIRELLCAVTFACFLCRILHANLWPRLRFMFVMKYSIDWNDFRQCAADNATWIMRSVACLVTNWRISPLNCDNHFSKFYERDPIDLYALMMLFFSPVLLFAYFCLCCTFLLSFAQFVARMSSVHNDIIAQCKKNWSIHAPKDYQD